MALISDLNKISRSVLIEKCLNIWKQIGGLNCVMNIEFDDVATAVEQVLSEVPGGLVLGSLTLQVRVQRTDAVALDVLLVEDGEGDTIGAGHELRNFSLGPRLFRAELIAGDGNDQETSLLMGVVHLLVRPIVMGQTSNGGNVDDDDGLGTLREFTHLDIRVFSKTTDL